MLNLKQLMARTDAERKQRAQYVKILKLKAGYTSHGQGFVSAQTYSRFKVDQSGKLVRNTEPTKYVSVIVFLNRKLQCKVACSCDDNMFRWEFANSEKGASEIEYSNGQPPVVTNPAYKPGLCKHLVALVEAIKPKLPSGTL